MIHSVISFMPREWIRLVTFQKHQLEDLVNYINYFFKPYFKGIVIKLNNNSKAVDSKCRKAPAMSVSFRDEFHWSNRIMEQRMIYTRERMLVVISNKTVTNNYQKQISEKHRIYSFSAGSFSGFFISVVEEARASSGTSMCCGHACWLCLPARQFLLLHGQKYASIRSKEFKFLFSE